MPVDRLDIAFSSWVTQRFAPEIEGYCNILLNRIDPIFEDVDGEARRAVASHEAKKRAHERA